MEAIVQAANRAIPARATQAAVPRGAGLARRATATTTRSQATSPAQARASSK
jgi:hypothetical protein